MTPSGSKRFAVLVQVALVLDVVVGEREVRLLGGQRLDGVDGQLAGATRVGRVTVHVLLATGVPHAVSSWVQVSAA